MCSHVVAQLHPKVWNFNKNFSIFTFLLNLGPSNLFLKHHIPLERKLSLQSSIVWHIALSPIQPIYKWRSSHTVNSVDFMGSCPNRELKYHPRFPEVKPYVEPWPHRSLGGSSSNHTRVISRSPSGISTYAASGAVCSLAPVSVTANNGSPLSYTSLNSFRHYHQFSA